MVRNIIQMLKIIVNIDQIWILGASVVVYIAPLDA